MAAEKATSQVDALAAEVRRQGEFIVVLESRLASMVEQNTSLTRRLEELAEELERQASIADGLQSAHRSMIVSRPHELELEDALAIMERSPDRRFVVVASGRTGLRPGEAFEPRTRFENPRRDLQQHMLSGLKIAATE